MPLSPEEQEKGSVEMAAVLADIAANPWPSDIGEARVLYDKMGPPIAADIRTQHITLGQVSGLMLTPPELDEDRAVLFLHGGGYVYGSMLSHGGMVAEIARAARCRALLLQYRLAPEHPFPAGIEDACAAYAWLLQQGYRPEQLALIGDSAGGGLVMSTLVALKHEGRPMPGAAVCISPWVDLASTGESYLSRQHLDPMIDRNLAEMLAQLYLQEHDRQMPAVSTIHAELDGLPPLLIQVGEREVLFSDAERLAARARLAGVDVSFEEWPGMVHVWHLYYPLLTAGRRAIHRVGDFVREKIVRHAVPAGVNHA